MVRWDSITGVVVDTPTTIGYTYDMKVILYENDQNFTGHIKGVGVERMPGIHCFKIILIYPRKYYFSTVLCMSDLITQ